MYDLDFHLSAISGWCRLKGTSILKSLDYLKWHPTKKSEQHYVWDWGRTGTNIVYRIPLNGCYDFHFMAKRMTPEEFATEVEKLSAAALDQTADYFRHAMTMEIYMYGWLRDNEQEQTDMFRILVDTYCGSYWKFFQKDDTWNDVLNRYWEYGKLIDEGDLNRMRILRNMEREQWLKCELSGRKDLMADAPL